MKFKITDFGKLSGHLTSEFILLKDRKGKAILIGGTVYNEKYDVSDLIITPYGDYKNMFLCVFQYTTDGKFKLSELLSKISLATLEVVKLYPSLLHFVGD